MLVMAGLIDADRVCVGNKTGPARRPVILVKRAIDVNNAKDEQSHCKGGDKCQFSLIKETEHKTVIIIETLVISAVSTSTQLISAHWCSSVSSCLCVCVDYL